LGIIVFVFFYSNAYNTYMISRSCVQDAESSDAGRILYMYVEGPQEGCWVYCSFNCSAASAVSSHRPKSPCPPQLQFP
jgi:hypothetical protein